MSNDESRLASINCTALLYGKEPPSAFDPSEDYHEASKFHEEMIANEIDLRLQTNRDLQMTASRSVKRFYEAKPLALPPPLKLDQAFGDLLMARSSELGSGTASIALESVSTLLWAAYGTTVTRAKGNVARTVPSGGALYPLDLYVCAHRVDGLAEGIYHYDPTRHVLSDLGKKADRLRNVVIPSELIDRAAFTIVIAAMFWRNRFRYRNRAYRFTLLEAGHVAQNAVLTATALGLRVLPIGAFFDDGLNALVGLDGVNEAALYPILVGTQ